MSENSIISKFVRDQLSVWPMAAANFRSAKNAETRSLDFGGLEVVLQHNPERIISTAGPVDMEEIRARKCFFCHRPKEQSTLRFDGRKGRTYDIAVNPYPIFPDHVVIASTLHTDQTIWHRFSDMCDLAHHFDGFTFFYNGPSSGASAPDHMHFQACPRSLMPLEREADRLLGQIAETESDEGVPNGSEIASVPAHLSGDIEYIASVQEAQVFHYKHFTNGVFFLRSRTSKSLAKLFYRLLDCAPVEDGEKEPRFNLLTWYEPLSDEKRPSGMTHGLAAFEYRCVVVFRSRHRSHHYYSEGPDHLCMSPGCADMMGYFVVPHEDDFKKLDSSLLGSLVKEVSVGKDVEDGILWRLRRTQPSLRVGIMAADEIVFEIISDGAGPQKVSYQDGKICYNGALYDELFFEAQTPSTLFAVPTFILHDVVIGIDFHWQRKVTQTFAGSLKFKVIDGKVQAINIIGVEDYLLSVISSEMRASANLEFLKTHAVISRSWVMSQLARPKVHEGKVPSQLKSDCCVQAVVTQLDTAMNKGKKHSPDDKNGETEYIKWFDHSDHGDKFDVCADDHCQRYQGLTLAIGENVRKAIDQTWGEVLTYGGEICDCRFSKCCGGVMERFSACWEDKDYPYLRVLPDTPPEGGRPFCDTRDKAILSQVLNDYDLETKDFFEWSVSYTRDEITELFRRRSGMDVGTIRDLIPLERGGSGRIIRLRVVGDKSSVVIGKELIIRRFLSESHLKSSAFDPSWKGDRLTLKGRGWGHGVGLCQIGAAVMSSRGYTYEQILRHYYPDTVLERIFNNTK